MKLIIASIVYRQSKYVGAVQQVAEQSMVDTVSEVQALPHYAQQGEVRMTVVNHMR